MDDDQRLWRPAIGRQAESPTPGHCRPVGVTAAAWTWPNAHAHTRGRQRTQRHRTRPDGGWCTAGRVGRERARLRSRVRARTRQRHTVRGNVSAAVRLEYRAHSHRDDHSRCVHTGREFISIAFPQRFTARRPAQHDGILLLLLLCHGTRAPDRHCTAGNNTFDVFKN